MKKIFTYLVAVSALLLTFSCNREAVDSFVNDEGISLKLVWSDMSVRTRVPGEDNENLVKSLDFYFYKDVTATSVYHYRETTIPAEDNYKKDFVPGEKYDGTNEFPKRSALVDPDNGCTVFVIANLDESKAPASATLATLRAIEVEETFLEDEPVIVSNTPTYASLATDDKNLYFVMTGAAQVQGTRKVLASAEPEKIELNRLAAKFTVNITATSTPSTDEETGITETWTPMLGGRNVRVYMSNTVSNAVLGGVEGDMPTSPTFFESNHIVLPFEVDGTWTENPTGTFKAKGVGHFYTYPNNWEEAGTDTFLKIVLPWQVVKKQNGNVIYSAEREVYYKVILPEKEILSNNWYDLSVTLEPGKEGEYEVEIPATYEVVNWTSGGQNGVNSTLKDILYLVVDYNDATGYDLDGNGTIDDEEAKIFVIYGEEASVHYSASNDVGYKVLRASYTEFNNSDFTATTKYIVQNGTYRYSDVGAGNGKRVGYPTTSNGTTTWNVLRNINTVNSWFSVGDSEDYLTLDHALNNTYTSDFFDISPYVFTVQVYLVRAETNPKYQKNVTFVQFPQTYLDLDLSPEKGQTRQGYSFGYVYVNDHTRTTQTSGIGDGTTRWYNITVIGNVADNSNPSMYVLTTGVLSNPDLDLKLGDPRTADVDNGPKFTNNTSAYTTYPGNATRAVDGSGVAVSFVNAPDVKTGVSRTLTNYHPADIAKSESFIAPKLRIQSGYGRRGSNSANGDNRFDYTWGSAWNRCAAYQEAGYPAGRWRMPTVAEIEYINTLSTNKFIPSLFYGTNYWSASPGVAYNKGIRQDNHFQGSIRCVYDDWYWGSEPVWDATTDDDFKWGD